MSKYKLKDCLLKQEVKKIKNKSILLETCRVSKDKFKPFPVNLSGYSFSNPKNPNKIITIPKGKGFNVAIIRINNFIDYLKKDYPELKSSILSIKSLSKEQSNKLIEILEYFKEKIETTYKDLSISEEKKQIQYYKDYQDFKKDLDKEYMNIFDAKTIKEFGEIDHLGESSTKESWRYEASISNQSARIANKIFNSSNLVFESIEMSFDRAQLKQVLDSFISESVNNFEQDYQRTKSRSGKKDIVFRKLKDYNNTISTNFFKQIKSEEDTLKNVFYDSILNSEYIQNILENNNLDDVQSFYDEFDIKSKGGSYNFFRTSLKYYLYTKVFYTINQYIERVEKIRPQDVPKVGKAGSPIRSDIDIPIINSQQTQNENTEISLDNKRVGIEIKSNTGRGGSGTFHIVFPRKAYEKYITEYEQYKIEMQGISDDIETTLSLADTVEDKLQFLEEIGNYLDEGKELCQYKMRTLSQKKISECDSFIISKLDEALNNIDISKKVQLKDIFCYLGEKDTHEYFVESSDDNFIYVYRSRIHNPKSLVMKYTDGASKKITLSDDKIFNSIRMPWLRFYYNIHKNDLFASIRGKGTYCLDEKLSKHVKSFNIPFIDESQPGSGAEIEIFLSSTSRGGLKLEANLGDFRNLKKSNFCLDQEDPNYSGTDKVFEFYSCLIDLNSLSREQVGKVNLEEYFDFKKKVFEYQTDVLFFVNDFINYIKSSGSDTNIPDYLKSNYKIKGNLLREVYSHLFKTKMNEGMFHMMHPYEYHTSNEFKLGGLLEIINEIENSTLKASEKLDGQNLWFGFRDGNPVFAYNMKELQAGGVDWEKLSEPYEIQDKKDIPEDFSGLEKIIRPHIRKEDKLIPSHGGHASFKDGIEVIYHCLIDAYSRDPQLIDFIFENGKNFSSSEVIHAEGPNQILYGENFIAPHFVMDKSGNQFPDKYKKLFSLLKFEQNKVKNPKGFKLLTREQRDAVALQIMEFDDEKEKLLFVKDLRDEYEKRIQSLINNTSLTLDSTVKDFHRYHLVNYINDKGEQDLSSNKSFVDSLLLFIHGSTLKASGLRNTPDYKNILKRLELGNAKSRGDFKSSYIGDIVEIFFDFGIDINRGIKTTATPEESQDINHQRITTTNLNNIKKAFAIAEEIELEVNRLIQLGEEENPEHKKLFSLARKLKFQISKVKNVIKRVKQRKGFTSNKDALKFIISSSIEGLVLNRKIPDSDSFMELKLTGFFAPLNQVLNAIRFEVGHIDLLDQFLESGGQIFSLNNQNIPTTYDIESLLERKLLDKTILTKANFSLLEMYNLKTYSEIKNNEFDIGFVPMSAKPFTIGHEDLVKTACSKSKKVYVVISITSRFRSHENPITGKSMERLYTEDNPSGFVRDLETLLNQKIPECKGKVKVIYSKNPQNEILEILDKEFSDLYLEKNNQYAIFVGDKEDSSRYKPELLGHMGDRLNVVYREEGEERLSSGTKTRSSLNTGRYTSSQEVPVKVRPGKTRTLKSTYLQQPYEEDSVEYQRSFEEFAANLSNIYSPLEKKRIYDYLSQSSKDTIYNTLDSLEGIDSNKEAKEKLSDEERNIMKALGGITSAKKLKDVYKDL